VRRIVVLLVLALVAAAAFGLSSASSGLSVNGASVSANTFRTELTAISSTPAIDCYITSLDPVSYAPGAGGATMAAAGAAAWANLRIEGIAIVQYVTDYLKFHATPAALAQARSSLEGEMTQSAAAASYRCPASSDKALAEMPAEMRSSEIVAQAASLYLVSKLNSTIPLTTASMRTYFAAHASSYDTLCVSIALVDPAQLAAFAAARSKGESVAALAAQFSSDASKSKGGAYGCYAPTSTSFASVRADVGTTKLDTFPATPQYISYNNSTYALFVAPTKRVPATFVQAASLVLADLKTINATKANTQKERILYDYTSVAVDPAFGRWGLNTTGPTVFVPAIPATGDVNSSKSLTSSSTTPYK
jgi:hypothetical protein